MRKSPFYITFVLAVFFIGLTRPVAAWSNGDYSSDPYNPDYGTHDYLFEHALNMLPAAEKNALIHNLLLALYGTELPDVQYDAQHYICYYQNGQLKADNAAVKAREKYNLALSYLRSGDWANADEQIGAMSHYITDVAVFAHVATYSYWIYVIHHSDYENYVEDRTTSYMSSTFDSYIVYDGGLSGMSAYDAATNLAYDITFGTGNVQSATWMDANYSWSNATFKDSCGASMDLAVNDLAEVLHQLYLDCSPGATTTTTALFTTTTALTTTTTSTTTRFPWMNGSTLWPVGVNLAWHDWDQDFLNSGWTNRFDAIKAQMDDMASKDVHALRWWVFPDGNNAPLFSGAGEGSICTGLPDNWINHMVEAADYARSKDIRIYFCFTSFDWGYNGKSWSHDDIIDNAIVRSSFIENAVKPILQALGTNQGILGWDVINEPEWLISSADGGDPNSECESFSLADMRVFAKDVVDCVHAYAEQPVSVGSASMKWCGGQYQFWTGLGLDFYDFHWYDWATPWFNPFVTSPTELGLDKPCIIGEMMPNTEAASIHMTHQQVLENLYANGYSGYLPWSWNDPTTNCKAYISPSFTNFEAAHPDVNQILLNGTTVTTLPTTSTTTSTTTTTAPPTSTTPTTTTTPPAEGTPWAWMGVGTAIIVTIAVVVLVLSRGK